MHRIRTLTLAALLSLPSLAVASTKPLVFIDATVTATQANLLVVVYALGQPKPPQGAVVLYANGVEVMRALLDPDGSRTFFVTNLGTKVIFTAAYLGPDGSPVADSTPVGAWLSE